MAEKAKIVPSKNMVIPRLPDLRLPSLSPSQPLTQPPNEAPQPKATLQYPAQRFSLSAGVLEGIIWVISEMWNPQHTPSMISRHRIDLILGQYLKVWARDSCCASSQGYSYSCSLGRVGWSQMCPMTKAQKATEMSPVAVMQIKQTCGLNRPRPKVVIRPAEMCDRQQRRLNSPNNSPLRSGTAAFSQARWIYLPWLTHSSPADRPAPAAPNAPAINLKGVETWGMMSPVEQFRVYMAVPSNI